MFEGKDVRVILANAGAGKEEWVEQMIPTPEGFKRFGDLKAGSFVYASDGKPTKVIATYPQGLKDAYKITFSDGRSDICGLEHLWGVYTRTGKHNDEWKYSVMELKDMIEKGFRRKDNRKGRTLGNPKFYIPASPVIQGESKNLECEPYVLGSFIGNGCCTLKYLTLSSCDEWQVNKCASILDCEVKKNSHNYAWTFFKKGHLLKTEEVLPLLQGKYSYEKEIPSEYIFASFSQRKALLNGLFDTDGSICTSNGRLHITYSTSSIRLCEDVRKLLLTFGIPSSVREDTRGKRINYNIYVHCSKQKAMLLFSLPRKLDKVIAFNKNIHRDYDKVSVRSIEKLEEKKEMLCIYVEDEKHLYLTKDFLVTHNTHKIIEEVTKELEVRRPEEVAFVTFTRKGAEEGLRRICSKLMLEADDFPYFRTLHSLTFHALNLKPSQMFGRIDQRKFNSMYGFNVNRVEVDTKKVMPTKDSKYLDFYDLKRSGALTSKQLAEADIDLVYYRRLVQKYEEYKSSNCLVDFFDCLIKYVQYGVPLPCKIIYVDECLSPDTKVRMADMSIKEIKDIKAGDFVMGTKGAVKVKSVHTGTDIMYNVVSGRKQVKYSCNSSHLIQQRIKNGFKWKHCSEIRRNAFYETARCKGEYKDLFISPYFFGLWLGNGFSRECVVVCNENDKETIDFLCDYAEKNNDSFRLRKRTGVCQVEYVNKEHKTRVKSNTRLQLERYGFMLSKTKSNVERECKEKRIPSVFLESSTEQRLLLLAGIIDSDGMYVKSGKHYKYRIEMARYELMKDIQNLVGSLGFDSSFYVTRHTTNGKTRLYYRIDFYGSSEIPCLLERKKFKSKPVNEKSCRIKKAYIGEYVGIEVDSEDNLFVLANGVVVHNCQDISALQWKVIEKAFSNAEKIVLVGDVKQCIYQYSGARPDFLIDFSRKFPTEHLAMSYRLPRCVYDLANAVTSFMGEKTEQKSIFREENPEGSITQLSDVGRLSNFIDLNDIKNNTKRTKWYLLARNKCYLTMYTEMLEEKIIPYWTCEGFFMGGAIMKRLKDYENFRKEGYKDEKAKEEFMRKFGIVDFNEPFTETNLFTEKRKWVYASYIQKYGLEKLAEMTKWNPQILVSTIHYVKGGEADNVSILLDATDRTKNNVFYDIDEELRVLYVGITRTRENLFLVDSKKGNGYDKIINVLKSENGLVW